MSNIPNHFIRIIHADCTAIEWDNMDSWQNKAINGIRQGSRAMFIEQLFFNREMAAIVHRHSMAVGLKVICMRQSSLPFFVRKLMHV